MSALHNGAEETVAEVVDANSETAAAEAADIAGMPSAADAASAANAASAADAASAVNAASVTGETEVLLSLTGAKKSFGENQVLKDISLQVKKGQVVGIIGPSGGGKSTLLRCATMLETLDGGALSYGNLVVCENGVYASKDVCRQAKMRFGLVFQNFNLFPHYTVLKNVMDAPLTVQKRDKETVQAEAMALLEKMGLSGKENMVPCELSGGQQQRVAIARALATKPDILFFDEPTSALDPELTQEVLRVIRELAQEHMTMVIVTHEMTFARDVADHIVFMDGGVIVEQGASEQVIDAPQHARTQAFLRKYE